MKVLIIIPAYNEAQNIEKTIKDVKENSEYDYIIINDCSKDNTKEICEKNNFNVISLPINYGLTSGIQLGMKYALKYDYDVAIQFDGDGQHQARYLKDLVKEIENGNDIVIGSRFVEKKKPFTMRMLGSRIITAMIKLTTGVTINDPTSGMRIINKELIKDYAFELNRKPEPDTLAFQIKKGYKAKEVQVKMEDRLAGTSIYTGIGSSIQYMLKVLVTIIFFN